MKEIVFVMPKMGESIREATVLRWLKKEGDLVSEGDTIVEVATDKVDSEIPLPYTGTLREILVPVGAVVGIGKPLARMATEANVASVALSHPLEVEKEPFTKDTKALDIPTSIDSKREVLPGRSPKTGRFYSPLVRHIASQEHIPLEELEQLPGTGQGARVTKEDMARYLAHRGLPFQSESARLKEEGPLTLAPGDEVMPMDRVRRMIAERMVASKRIAPHVTSFVEADISNLVDWRMKHKAEFQQKYEVPLTYTAFFVYATAAALKQFPLVNAAVSGNTIIKKKAINIGLAVAMPNGNLVVPVIRAADTLSLTQLALQIHDLANRTRLGMLKPEEVTEGTYTISNIGTFQSLMGTPIILQPQVAILAFGAIVKKPSVVSTVQGDQVAIRHRVMLSHTYDHRIVDGALGGYFAHQVVINLADLDLMNIL